MNYLGKYLLISSLLGIAYIPGRSQNVHGLRKKADYDVLKFDKVKIHISSGIESLGICNVRSISVMDARPDTSVVGIFERGLNDPSFIIVDGGLKKQAELLMNKCVPDNTGKSNGSILVILKKFWLTDDLDPEDTLYNQKLDRSAREHVNGFVMAILDFFYGKDEVYYPLYRYDTTIVLPKSVQHIAGDMMEAVFSAAMSKVTGKDKHLDSLVSGKRRLRLEEIQEYYSHIYDFPILKDTVLRKGVYMDADELKNNSPSQLNFKIEKTNVADMMYITQANGAQIPIRNDWGYCDGIFLYVRSRDKYYRLQRIGNSYYIYGSKRFLHSKNPNTQSPGVMQSGVYAVPSPLAAPSPRPVFYNRPFVLDWDNGKLE
jgi:hypothetical protein